jgi:hypothetical protein
VNNLLAQAHQLIPYQRIQFSRWLGSTKTANLLEKDKYAPPVSSRVKINAVKTKLSRELGLDYKKTYVRLFSTPKVSGLSRISSGDQFNFDGAKWQVESQTGWKASAGWDSFLCVKVG